jgi:hypothetical protein
MCAATGFEAVCVSAIFKHSVVEDPTWAAEFVVEIKEQSKPYRVEPAMKKWLACNGKGRLLSIALPDCGPLTGDRRRGQELPVVGNRAFWVWPLAVDVKAARR